MVESFFDPSQPNALSQLVFGDGTVWDNATIRSHVVDLSGAANGTIGTSGNDSFTVDHRGDTIADPSSTDVDSITASVNFTLPTTVESLVLTGPLNLSDIGNSRANTITGNNQANFIDGAGGMDTLIGGRGDDTYRVGLLGGTGATVIEIAAEGVDTLLAVGGAAYVLPSNVERLVVEHQSVASGSLVGNELDNFIDARGSSAGALTIDGGAGADYMIGHRGSDRFIVDNIGDVVQDYVGEGYPPRWP